MIIKKKYTDIKKLNEIIEVEDNSETDLNLEKDVESVEEENTVQEEEAEKNDNNDLDLTLDNIKFEQRGERREGTRRRGYRRSQDRNLISRAQEEAVAIREAAKQDGFKEGINKAESAIAELKNNLSEFYTYKEEVFNKVSECILDIAVEIAKKIIKKETQTDSAATLAIIKEALEEVNKTENKITIKVMPKDVEIVRDKIPEMISSDYYEAQVIVVPDNTIKEGGVIIETSNGIVDATIGTQLEIIKKALITEEGN